jgi:hypothetical protein
VILPQVGSEGVARAVADHASELYAETLTEMPWRGAAVCSMVAEYARSSALCAWMQCEALRDGVDSGRSMGLLSLAGKLGAQADRALEGAWRHAERVGGKKPVNQSAALAAALGKKL